MLNHLDGLRISLKRQLRSVSAKEVAKPDVTTKEQAVERVLRVLFRPEFLIPLNQTHGVVTRLSLTAPLFATSTKKRPRVT